MIKKITTAICFGKIGIPDHEQKIVNHLKECKFCHTVETDKEYQGGVPYGFFWIVPKECCKVLGLHSHEISHMLLSVENGETFFGYLLLDVSGKKTPSWLKIRHWAVAPNKD